MPSRATMPSKGRLFATAGWEVMPRRVWATPRIAAGEAAPEAPRAAIGVNSVAAVISLISHRHAHDVSVGGQESVPDLKGRLEADRRLLARQHHGRDVRRLAPLIGLRHRRGLRLGGIDLVDRVAQRIAEAAGAGRAAGFS